MLTSLLSPPFTAGEMTPVEASVAPPLSGSGKKMVHIWKEFKKL